jgi:T4 bacteriophage base plate protein
MSKVVNDNYPNRHVTEMSDEEIKAKFLAEATNTGAVDAFQKIDFPTEVIDLPSRGYFYPEGHPLASGKIEMKYMTAKEEDILASQNLIKQGVVIDKLLQSLIVTKCNYNDILTIDKNAIFIAARILGYGNNYEAEIACPSCGAKHKHNIDLAEFEDKETDWSKFTKGQTTFNFTLPASKREVTLKFLTHGDEKLIEEEVKSLKKLTKIVGVDPELTTRLKHVIVAIDGDNNKATINKAVDSMLSRDSLALRQHLKQITPDIDTTFNYTCPSCDFEIEKMAMPIGVGFFWPGV